MLRVFVAVCLGVALVLSLSAGGRAAVDLEWRPAYQVVHAGDLLRVGLCIVSDTSSAIPVSGLDAVVIHDSAVLDFQNLTPEGSPYRWLVDGFLWPSPENLNDALDDGQMYYTAWAQLGIPAMARTHDGLLVTTLEFIATQPACRTIVEIPATFGSLAQTRVMDGTIPNYNILGKRGTARIMVVEPGVVTSVAAAKQLPDNSSFVIAGPIVTRSFGSFFYIEDFSRAAGIKVSCNPSLTPASGATPRIWGTIRTVGGERVIEATNVTSTCPSEAVPGPLGLNGRAPYDALKPLGLLVTVWGRAVDIDQQAGTFQVADGNSTSVRVKLYGLQPPQPGRFLVVTGIMAVDTGGPLVRVCQPGDMVQFVQ